MFVRKIKNQVKIISLAFGVLIFSSMPVESFTRAFHVLEVAYASPVTADRLIELTNEARAENGLSTLSINSLLVTSAQGKSNDMLEKNYFAHTSPEGLTPWYWFKEVGYNYIYAGENLAKNYASAEAMFDAWMASPTHRANILSANFKEIGIAVAAGDEVIYVTQHFGARSTSTAGANTTPTPQSTDKTPAKSVPIAVADTEAPKIAEFTIPSHTLKQGGKIAFSLEVDGDPTAVTVKAGKKSIDLTESNGRWIGELTLYAGGTYEVTVEAKDAAGNTATSTLGTVTVEVPAIEKPETKTLVAGYLKDMVMNEAAPIMLALIAMTAIAGYAVSRHRLSGISLLSSPHPLH